MKWLGGAYFVKSKICKSRGYAEICIISWSSFLLESFIIIATFCQSMSSGDKRARDAASNAAHERRERKRLRAILAGKNYSDLLPEIHRLIHIQLPLSSILDVMSTQKAFHEPQFRIAFWREIASLELRSIYTQRAYRYLVNANRLWDASAHLRVHLPEADKLELEAVFRENVYMGSGIAIRAILIILQNIVRPLLTQSKAEALKLLPQDEPALIEALILAPPPPRNNRIYTNTDAPWDGITLSPGDTVGFDPDFEIPPSAEYLGFGQRQPNKNPRAAHLTIPRNNWLANGNAMRRQIAMGPIYARPSPGATGMRQLVARPVFEYTPEEAVLFTSSVIRMGTDLPLDKYVKDTATSVTCESVPYPIPRYAPVEDFVVYHRDRAASRDQEAWTSRYATWVYILIEPIRQPPFTQRTIKFQFLAQRCHDGLQLELDARTIGTHTSMIPLVGIRDNSDTHQVTFHFGDRKVMSGVCTFGYELSYQVQLVTVDFHHALFLRAIDLDALIDWHHAQCGERGIGGLLELVAWTDITTESGYGPYTAKIAKGVSTAAYEWRTAHGRSIEPPEWDLVDFEPLPDARGPVIDMEAKRRMYMNQQHPYALELAIWDYDELVADIASCGIVDPVELLMTWFGKAGAFKFDAGKSVFFAGQQAPTPV